MLDPGGFDCCGDISQFRHFETRLIIRLSLGCLTPRTVHIALVVPFTGLEARIVALLLPHLVQLAHVIRYELLILGAALLQVFTVELLPDVHWVQSCRSQSFLIQRLLLERMPVLNKVISLHLLV